MSTPLTSAQRQALQDAAQWFAEMQAETVTPELKTALQRWLDDNAVNQWAWQQLEQLQSQLAGLPEQVSFNTLTSKKSLDRRQVLRSFAALAALGVTSWGTVTYTPVRRWMADYHTATGETRTIMLADGSEMTLNTATAIDIDFSAEQRRITLRAGEVMIKTAGTADNRPFLVEGRDGVLQPMGTRFSVWQQDEQSVLSVFEDRVALHTANAGSMICEQGNQLIYRAGQVQQQQVLTGAEADWLNGKLVANAMPLDEFVMALSRYRPGFLQCEPTLSRFKISGTFNTNNTEQVLTAIGRSFPVQIEYRSRFWVKVAER